MVSKYSIVRRKSLVSDNECSELFRLKKFPIHMLKASSEQTTLCNDMIFGIDESCGFIQLLETIPKEILYKDSHSNAIGKTWYNHHELLADTVLKINPENVLEIGGGTGFLAKTLVYALADSDEEAREFIAAYLDEQFAARDRRTGRYESTHKHKQFDRTLSPRTLKRAVMGQNDWIMGLCALRRVDDVSAV